MDYEAESVAPETVESEGPSQRKRKAEAAMAEVEELRGEVRALQATMREVTQQLAQARTSPSVRAPLPETFKGQTDDFRFFIGTVRAYCDLTNVPVDKRVDLAVSCLAKGPAKIWASHRAKLMKDNLGDPKDFELFVTCMTRTYDSGDRAAKARVKLDKIYQGADTLERYVERFMSLVAEIEAESDLSASEKLHRFKHGLKTELQFSALLDTRTGKPFEDLGDLIQFLTRYDAAVGGVSGQEKGPRANAMNAERPAKRGRGHLKPARLLHIRANLTPDWAEEEYYMPPPRRPFAAAAMGPAGFPGRQPVRQYYPRMDGLPPGHRVDMRANIPLDRFCYVCGQRGCESWKHTKPGVSYRDALMRPAPPNRTVFAQDRTRVDPESRFYDRFALGRGQGRRKGPGRFGMGRARPL